MEDKEFYKEYINKLNKLVQSKIRSTCYKNARFEVLEKIKEDKIEFELWFKQDDAEHCIMKKHYLLTKDNTEEIFRDWFYQQIFEVIHRTTDSNNKDIYENTIKSYSCATLINTGLCNAK